MHFLVHSRFNNYLKCKYVIKQMVINKLSRNNFIFIFFSDCNRNYLCNYFSVSDQIITQSKFVR